MVLFFPGIYVFRVTKNWKTPTVCNGEPHQKRHWSKAISLLPVHSLRLQAEQKWCSPVEPQIPKIVHYLDPNERDPELCCFGGEAMKSFQISYVTALRIRWKEMAYSCISEKKKRNFPRSFPKDWTNQSKANVRSLRKAREKACAKSLDLDVASDWVRCCNARDFRANRKALSC